MRAFASFVLSAFLLAPAASAADSVSGNFSTSFVFDSGGSDRGRAVAVEPSSYVYVAGKKPQSPSGMDWVVLKLDPTGAFLSSTSFDSGATTFEEPMDAIVAGPNLIVVGSDATSRRLNVYSTGTLQTLGSYRDGVSGRFTAVISSGPNSLITASVAGGQMIVNELAVPSLVMVATRVIPGFYAADRHARTLAHDPVSGWIYAVAVDSTTGGLRVEQLGANLALLGATNFFKANPFVGGAALAWSGSGLYVTGIASAGAQVETYLMRLSGLTLLQTATATASGFISGIDERVVVIDPATQDVYLSGSGPFPGIVRFPSDLSVGTTKSLFPTSSMVIRNAANIYAIEVNQTGPQDIQVHRKDFNSLPAGGGGGGLEAVASDGSFIYAAKNLGGGSYALYKLNPPANIVSSAAVTGVGEQTVRVVRAGANVYMAGSASSAYTLGQDAAVWKFDAASLTFLSSRTHSATGVSDDFIIGATVAAEGHLYLTGARSVGAGFELVVWKYDAAADLLVSLASTSVGSVNFGAAVVSTGTAGAPAWVVGFSSKAAPGANKMALTLWKAYGATLTEHAVLPGFAFNTDLDAALTSDGGFLYAAAERLNTAGNFDLAVVKYDLTGATVAEAYWHTAPTNDNEEVGAIVFNSAGDLVVVGGAQPIPSGSSASAYWSYTTGLGLNSGFPKTVASIGSIRSAAPFGSSIYAVANSTDTPFLLTGGSALAGAAGLQGAGGGGPSPAVLTYSGSLPAGANVNSVGNRNEALFGVLVDTSTGNVFTVAHSTTNPTWGATPDDSFVLKFSPSGVVLASAPLQGTHSGDALAFDGANVYLAEKAEPNTRRLVKFDANLVRIASAPVDAAAVGNITRALFKNGFLYTINDGGSSSRGAKLIKYDAALNEVARSTLAPFAAGDHHNGDDIAANVPGDIYVAVTSPSLSVIKGAVYRFDANLVQLSSADLTGTLGSMPRIAYGGNKLFVASGDNAPPAHAILHQYDAASLSSLGLSSFVYVAGASVDPALAASSTSLVLGLTSSTADGGNFFALRLDHSFARISSGLFDAGFGGADSLLSAALGPTDEVYLAGVGRNGGHDDGVLMVRTLPAGAAGVGPVSRAALAYSGSLPAGFRVNSTDNRNEAVQELVRDPGTGNLYAIATSTTPVAWDVGPWDSTLLKLSPSGAVLASATLPADNWAFSLALEGGSVFVGQTLGEPTYNTGVLRYDANTLLFQSSTTLGSSGGTRVVGRAGVVYALVDGGPQQIGGVYPAIIVKYNASLTELARTTWAVSGVFESHPKAGIVDLGGNLYVAVSSRTSTRTDLVKFDVNLQAVGSSNITGLVGSDASGLDLAYGSGKLYAFAKGTTEGYVRRFTASTLAYDNVSATINVAGATPWGALSADTANVVTVGMTTPTAGGDFLVRRFDADLLPVSSGVFDGGFGGADSLGALLTYGTTGVYLAGTGRNASHDDGLVLLRGIGGLPPPPPPPGGVEIVPTGSFLAGARINNSANGADIGHRIAVAEVGGTTFVYVTIHSTSAASPGLSPDQLTLAKYNLTGAFFASATVQGVLSGDMLVAEGGFLFVSEKDGQGLRRIARYTSDLVRQNTVTVDPSAVGNITDGFGRGGFLYTVNDGGNASNGAKVVKYDLNLNEVRRATVSFGAQHVNGNGIVVTPNGEVIASVTSSSTVKLVKFDGNLNPLAEADVSGLFSSAAEDLDLAFANGVLMAGGFNALGDVLTVRKFDPALSYSGAFVNIPVRSSPGFGLKAGPEGLFYVAATSYSADGGDYRVGVYDPDLVLKASASFDAGFGGGDQAVGLAVLDSSNVFITGTGSNAGNFDAVTIVRNLSAAGAGSTPPPGQEGGFWGLAGKDSRVWAVHQGLGVVRRYDSPLPPVSRTTPFQQALGSPNGVIQPTALGVDGGGNLWVSVSSSPGAAMNTRLVRFASQGGPGEVAVSTSAVLANLLKDVHAVAFRQATGDMYVAQGGNTPSIVMVARDAGSTLGAPTYSNAGASTFTATAVLADAEALAFDSGGNLWATARTLGRVVKFPLVSGSISQSTAQALAGIATPTAIAFDASGNMYVGETTEVTPFSGKLWKFPNQGTLASPVFSGPPQQLQSGVDPTALALIAGQLWGSSDLNDHLVVHSTVPPAAPPSFGAIGGLLSYGGAQSGPLYIAFSTHPFDIRDSDAATLIVSTGALGSYLVSTLRAPNTFYISAVRDSNFNGPNNDDPFGRYSAAFSGPRTPVYVAPEQTVTGVNVHIVDLIRATGTVVNNSVQAGDIRVQPWYGAPSTATPQNQLDFGQWQGTGSSVPYAVYSATISNLYLLAWVDSNFNSEYEVGEDNGIVGPINLSALTPPATAFAGNITIGAGPAGQLRVAGTSVIGANIPSQGAAAFLRLGLWSEGGSTALTRLRVKLLGDAPSPNVYANLYRDANGDGVFQDGLDYVVANGFFSGSPSRADVVFFSTQTVTASTQTYFLGLGLFGVPAGKSAGLSVEGSSSFFFAAGSLAAGQAFPIESSLAVAQFSLAARPLDQGYPVPQGGANPSGGFDTGLFVSPGQRVAINAQGSWNTGTLGASGPGGIAGQTNGSAPAPSANLGALIARIGGSSWFLVGAGADFIASQSGPLALAMNDTNYSDNASSLLVDFQIVPSTVTRTWLGASGFGLGADIPQNWQGGQLPQSGESIVFDGAVSNADCDWNLFYFNAARFEMKNGYSGRVRLKGSPNPDDFNQLFVSSNALILSGTLDLARNKELRVDGLVRVHGTLDMGADNTALGAGAGVLVDQGGVFRFAGNGFARVYAMGFAALDFNVAAGTVDIRGTGFMRMERPDGVTLSASANILAFNNIQFDQFDSGNPSASALDIMRSTAGVYVFKGLEFMGALNKNVDADNAVAGNSITLLDSRGPKRGSPFERDLNNVVFWVPDGGGVASIAGSVLDGGVTISGSTVVVRASTQPFFDPNAFFGGLAFISTRNSFGVYTLSGLDAPATYYLYAHRESIPLNPNDYPDGSEPRGAFGNPGLLRSAPVFVAPGQNLTGKDITLKNWAEATGSITNNSSQSGPILIATALDVSTTTLESISFPNFGGSFPPLAGPATSLLYVAWVDVNNNRQKDGFEAAGTFGPAVPPISTVTLALGGGAAAPGGTLTLTTAAAHAGILGDMVAQAVMRLTLTAAGSQATLTGLKLDYSGGPNQFGLSAWRDANGNGLFDSESFPNDMPVGSTQAFNGGSSALINFHDPVFIPGGESRTLFVVFEPRGLTAGHPKLPALGVSLGSSNYFLLSAGQMATQPLYPVQTSAPIGWSVMAQTEGDSFGGGGYYTGAQVAGGQQVTVTAAGSWRFNGQTTGITGIAGTEGQPTLSAGKRVGQLLASVGNGWFAVGSTGTTVTAPFFTTVHLSANDVRGDYFNNDGRVTADIAVSGSTTSRVQGLIGYQGGLTGNLIVNLTQDCQFAPAGCNPIVSTQVVTLAGGTTQYAYGLHIPFSGFFGVRAVVQNNTNHRSGFMPQFQAPLGSTATVNFVVSSGLGAISSTITYSGVMTFGSYRVGVTTSPDLEKGAEFFGGYESPNAGFFTVGDLPIPNTFYLVAFKDGNFNREPDGPEPLGGYASVPSSQLSLAQLSSTLLPIFVSSNAQIAPIALTDRGGISGRLTFQQAVPSGLAVIAAAHGLPGSPDFRFENRDFRFVQNIPAGGSVDYFLGLLTAATDYTLFAFLDQNFNDAHDPSEPFGQSAGGFIAVPSGGFANRDLTIGAPAAPPAVTGFFVGPFTTSQVEFRWDATPGATGYFLLDASSAVVQALPGSATHYVEFTVPAGTSAATGIRAVNNQGSGPIARLPFVNSAQAGVAPAPVLTNVAVSSLVVTWSAGTNGSLARYQVDMATAPTGPFQGIFYGSGTFTKNQQGLAPTTAYYFRVRAQSPNGGFAAPSAASTATTAASADSSISGLVTYAGQQAGPIVVRAGAFSVTMPNSAQQPYYLAVPDASYSVLGFVDVDGDGFFDAGEDSGAFGSPVTVSGGPQTGKNFAVAVDTVAPGIPAGLRAFSPLGRVDLTWNPPSANVNGTALTDLAGYRVQRTTSGPLNFVTLTTATVFGVPNLTAAQSFTDASPVGGVDNVYRVVAVDWGRNATPSGAIAIRPALGGTISGSVSSFTATTSGAFRVRLSTSPRGEDPFLSESTLLNFSFTGLSDGSYFLRGFRDTDANNQQNAATEPSGTHGGIVAPFRLDVVNGNAITNRVVTVCDRSSLTPGQGASGSLAATDCPASDKGQGFHTDLYTFRVGGGAAGSIGQGSTVDISLSPFSFDGELIVLGPDGQVVARDNTAGNPHVTFTAHQAGLYVVEPTSFFPGQTGGYSLLLSVFGGFSGRIAGESTYSGTKTGPLRLQLFDRQDSNAFPFFVASTAALGAFELKDLRDGTLYLRAFRDTNGNMVKDPGEPSGAYGFSESSPTAISVVGGVPSVSFVTLTLADPSTGRIEGSIVRQGSLPGTIRIEVGPRACNDCNDLNVVAFTTRTGAGSYALDFIPPATTYIVQAFVDGNANNRNDALEAYGSSSPITVAVNSTATVNVLVRDPGTGTSGNSVLFGTVTYTGSRTGTLFVGFATDQNFSYIPYYLTQSATGYFSRSGVQGGATYYVGAFIDANGNGTIDEGGDTVEPSGNYNGQLFVPVSSSVGVAFTINDAPSGVITGSVTYNGAASGALVVQAQVENRNLGGNEGGWRQVILPRTVGVSSYAYSAGFLAQGDFRLYAFVDANGNQRSDFGEPFFRRETLVSVSSGAGAPPVTGVNILVLDAGAGGGSGAIGTVSGSVQYFGVQGGGITVQLFSTSAFVGAPLRTVTVGSSGNQPFAFDNLNAGTYWVRAFKDTNANQILEPQYEANGLVNNGNGITVTNDFPFSGGNSGVVTDVSGGGFSGSNSFTVNARYQGALTTGTWQFSLFTDGQTFPARIATAAFAAGVVTRVFSDLAQARYYPRVFLDRNGNMRPDSDEPLGLFDAEGEFNFGSASVDFDVCDRAPLDTTPGATNAGTITPADCRNAENAALSGSDPSRRPFQKMLTFRGSRGQTLDATMDAAEDSYLYLYDEDGVLVAEADGGAADPNDSRLVVTLPRSGLFTLAASFFAPGITGPYRILLQNSGGAAGSISGEVRYTGSQGGRIQMALFNNTDFDAEGSFVDGRELYGPGAFSFSGLASQTTYYMGAFVDVNFNRQPDQGEDFAFYSTAPPTISPVYLLSGQDLGGLILDIQASTAAFAGKEGQVTGEITYAGSRSGALRVEFWADARFQGAPLAVRSIPTGPGPYDLSVPGGQPYVVRGFLDLNGDFIPNPDEPQGLYAPGGFGAEPVYVPANGTVAGVSFALRDVGIKLGQTEPSGEGTLNILPTAFASGGFIDRVTFTYVASGAGVREGGRVVIGMPFGFPFPNRANGSFQGYVSTASVTNPAGLGTPLVRLDFPAGAPAFEARVVSSTPLYAGATVQFTWANIPVPCFAQDITFFAGSASTGTVPPSQLLSGAPGVTFGPGQAASVRSFENTIGLLQNTTSQRLLLEAVDSCGNRRSVTANANVVLRAKRYDYAAGGFLDDAALRVSSSPTGVFDSTAVVTFLAGQSTASYRLRGTAGGEYFLEMASNLLAPGATGYAAVSILANNTLSDVSVSTVPFQLGRTSATIVPPAQAFINFTLGDPNRFWTVAIASTPFKTDVTPEPVSFFSGFGQPARGQIAWDGRSFSGQRVPRGAYYVRVEVNGLRDDSLRISVDAPELRVKVVDGGVTPNLPLVGVAGETFGALGGGASFATDASGEATLAGLSAGDYRLTLFKDGYLPGRAAVALTTASAISTMTATDSNVSLSSTAAGVLQVVMRRAPSLVVVPSIAAASTQPFNLWGGLQVENTTRAFVLNGPLFLPEGTTTFNDGGQYDFSLNAYVTKTIFRFNVASDTYTVRASLPGFDDATGTVFVADSGQTTLTLPAFTKRSAFTGLVFLPAGNNTAGTFVSVNAVPITTTTALEGGFGGVFIPANVATGTYRVDGLRPGSYRLQANTQGLKAVFIDSATIVAGADTVVDFSSFPVANTSVIVATVGVTGIAGNSFPELEPGGPGMRLNISAWSPSSPNGFYQTVSVSTVGVSSATVIFSLTGLDQGVPYQIFSGIESRGDAEFDVPGGFPKVVTVSTTTGRGEVAFDFAAASGVIAGTLYLPAGSRDFVNVDLFGRTIASARPDSVGHTFQENALTLPNFVCGDGSAPAGGLCPVGVNVASFTVRGLNTETNDITLTYKTTGRTVKTIVSVVNGSTTTVLADLRDPTYRVTGVIVNQVTDPLFNTNDKVVVNAASVPVRDGSGNRVVIDTATVDLGGVGSVDSLARVVAIRQQFGVAASTSFNPATDRVGYLTTAGTYTIRNLTPGVYLLRTAEIRSCATCQVVIPRRVQVVSVTNADVQASSFTLSDGFTVTGIVSLRSGVQDSGTLRLTLRNRRLEVVRSTTVALGNAAAGVVAGSVAYRLDGVPGGEFYTLSVEDSASQPRYIGRPLAFPDPTQSPTGLQSNLPNQDVLLRRAGYLTGQLKDGSTGELFTERNARVLPPNLRIIAVANPWVEGGFAQAASSVSARPIRADGTFLVGPLFPEIPYDLKVFQDKWDLAFLAQGSQNYAPVEVGGLVLQPLQLLPVGTLTLNQGTSIKGTLVDAASTTTALGNIRVTAKPSVGDLELNVEAYSNALGQFTLWVSTSVSAQFNVTVAPRDGNQAANGKRYRTVELPRYTVSDASITLLLSELAAPVTGQVTTADGGPLSYPYGEDFPAAAVFLQPVGVIPSGRALGDIAVETDPAGFFTVPSLSSGSYRISVVSRGYGVATGTVTVTQTSFCITTTTVAGACQAGLTLRRAGIVQGSIALTDGTSPSTEEIGAVVAVSTDDTRLIDGSLVTNSQNRTVTGYSITGFQPGVSYNIVLLPPSREDADVVYPSEGQGILFTAAESTTTKTVNLTYRRVIPDCEASAVEKALGNNQFQVKITCTDPLRKKNSDDDNVDKLLTVSSCVVNGSTLLATGNNCGSLLGGADKKIESNRKTITAVYRAGGSSEEGFTLKLDAYAATTDPTTGDNFRIAKTFTFQTIFRSGGSGGTGVLAGSSSEEDRVVVSNAEEQISNAQGGPVNLLTSEKSSKGEQFTLNFQPNTFVSCAPGDTNSNCEGVQADKNKVKMTVKGSLGVTDAAARAQATLGYVPERIQALRARAGSFGPLAASSSTKNSYGRSPLSTFYDIFLPLGIRSQLSKPVDLTMPYDLSLSPNTPISDVQVWSKSIGNIGKAGCTGQLCPETGNKRIDTINKTITVSVDHFSQFVVLNGPPALSGSATFREDKPIAFNFPNPFDCKARTVSCNTAEGSCAAGSLTGVGTVIHYAAPGSSAANLEHRFRIYNVAGELVDEFTKVAAGGTHHYDFWDCTNKSGRPVASGVYILEYKVNGQSVYHKMAVIKGSGL